MRRALKHHRRFLFLLVVGWWLAVGVSVQAVRVDELQSQIDDRNRRIQALEAEIKQYQSELAATNRESASLQEELRLLDQTIKKLEADIKLTETKISKTELTIQQLSLDIGRKEASIEDLRAALGEGLRRLAEAENTNFLHLLLSEGGLSEWLRDEEQLTSLEGQINDRIGQLRELRDNLKDRRQASERERQKLTALRNQLADQKKITDQSRQTKNQLLSQTKNQETAYRKLLSDRRAKKEAFEKELEAFEAQLRLAINFAGLPPAGTRVLAWPLDSVFITQQFGKTVDSVRLYASGTHNGIDLRASVGTTVKAAAPGTVVATGNTDTVCRGASYGKWVLIRHTNGLSTLYAHLTLIKVTEGQNMGTGDLVGYSGQTGYATGPHLHFTVYATDGVRVQSLKSKVCDGTYVMPVADTRAYLDPLTYL